MQVVASLFTLLLAVTTVNAQGDSSPVLQRIAKTKILRVGMTGEQPPFNVKNRDGKLIGVDVDLGQALARSMGVTLEIVEMPFAKLLPALEDGKVDIVMSGMTITLQRNVRVPFVGPYHVSGKSTPVSLYTTSFASLATDLTVPAMPQLAPRVSSMTYGYMATAMRPCNVPLPLVEAARCPHSASVWMKRKSACSWRC